MCFYRQTVGRIVLVLLVPSAYASALPGDSTEGKRLHDANCMGCHDTSIYSRKDRLIHSLDALRERLGDCSHMATKNSPRLKRRTSSST